MKLYKVIRLRLPRGINLRNLRVWHTKKRYRRRPSHSPDFLHRLLLFFALIFILVLFGKVLGRFLGNGRIISTLTAPAEKETAPEENAESSSLKKQFLFLQETLPFFHKTADREEALLPPAAKTQAVFSIDPAAYISPDLLSEQSLLSVDASISLRPSKNEPQILIFHTHSQEEFADSRSGVEEDTIVGVGTVLADLLTNEYGIGVIHDTGVYDLGPDGKLSRGQSYETMETAIKKVLEQYPSIEVLLDLHRDGVNPDLRLLGDADGKKAAKLMFVVGACMENDNGLPVPTAGLENPYIKENLGFAYQVRARLAASYETLLRPIYIKPYRYSLHLRPLSLLVEVGANTSTIEEAENAMAPLAQALMEVLAPNESTAIFFINGTNSLLLF